MAHMCPCAGALQDIPVVSCSAVAYCSAMPMAAVQRPDRFLIRFVRFSHGVVLSHSHDSPLVTGRGPKTQPANYISCNYYLQNTLEKC
eukprot:scaffold45388_cov49-Phaeocystis_antarctica.AAC.1